MTAVRAACSYLLSPRPGVPRGLPVPLPATAPLSFPCLSNSQDVVMFLEKARAKENPPPVRGIDKQQVAESPNVLIH